MSAQFPVTPSLSPSLPMNSFLYPKVQNCQPQLSGSSEERAAAAVAFCKPPPSPSLSFTNTSFHGCHRHVASWHLKNAF